VVGAAALAIACLALLSGCGLEEERPEEIPPPPTPTDQREARRVAAAAAVYLRDQRLIRETSRSCGAGLSPGLFGPVCGPELRPLLAQRRTHLRTGLAGLPQRVGPRCAEALREVREAPIERAAAPLRAAATACRGEYRRALAEDPRSSGAPSP
jgi:hypothetical protein